MKQKNETVIYAGKGKSSEMIQRLLFSYGYTWNTGQDPHAINREIFIYIYHNKLTLDFDEYEESMVFDIDGTKFFHEVISLCDRLKTERDNVDLEKEVKELRKWKAEHMELESHWDVQAVGKEMDLPLGKSIQPNILPFIKELKSQNERLKRENIQLNDDLEHKEESFPEGYDWHNPDGLTASQVGFKDGWRLLLKSEVFITRELTEDVQKWTGNDWDNTGWVGNCEELTYRVKWPIPSNPEPVTDDFPTPEKQEKEAGLKWFLNYLKCCKEVHGWVSGKPREVEVNFGKCGGGAKIVLHGEDICLLDNYGDTHQIAITKIIP